MKMKIRNRLEMLGSYVAVPIPPSSPELRAWLAIYPVTAEDLEDSVRLRRELVAQCANVYKYMYRILQFELPVRYLENDLDFNEGEMVNKHAVVVCTLEDVERVLAERNISSEDLTEPWKTDYPL